MMTMTDLWNNLLNLFFPNLCLICKRPLVGKERHLCLHCLCRLPRTRYHQRKQNPMEQRYFGNVLITHATSFLLFEKENSTQRLIHFLKYHDNKELAYHLGQIAAHELQDDNHPLCQVDGLIPVPLHPKKQKIRGYNQSEWIAKGIQSVWGCPVYPHALKKTTFTESQTLKSGFERWENTRNVYETDQTDHLTGKHLLIIDDVITTGATIGACAAALSAVPDIRISLFSLAAVTK